MPLPKEDRYTYADALTWDESERIELIYGQPYMMAPPSRAHQETVMALLLQFGNYLKGKRCRVYPAPFGVRLFAKKEDPRHRVDTLVEPDITVVCDPERLDEEGCCGAPDLIVEVLSPSTQRHDRLTKLNLYRRAGVREYWIVDPVDKVVSVFTLKDGRYYIQPYGADASVPVSVLEDCAIDLSAVFPEP